MKWNVQVLPTMAFATVDGCRRALNRALGNAVVAGELSAYEIGDVTDRNDPSLKTASSEIEALCVVDAETRDEAAQKASAIVERFGVQAGHVAYFETSDDITVIDDDVETMDEVPGS